MHHHFLQWVDLSRLDHPTELSDGGIAEVLEKEVMFMVAEGKLPPESERMLDLPSLEHFFGERLGRHLIRHAGQIQRELPFTAKFQLDELIQWGLSQGADLQENPDFVVVQGMVDVAIIQPESIQILDYKTDQVSGPLLEERIKGYHLQLRLYAEALQRVYRKPVTHLLLHLLATQETRTVATHPLDKDIVCCLGCLYAWASTIHAAKKVILAVHVFWGRGELALRPSQCPVCFSPHFEGLF